MDGLARWTCLSMILLAAVSIPCHGSHAETQGRRPLPRRIERDIERFKTVATDNVMKLLAIKPGMTILDIGAGTGQFAYEFAGRVTETGKVYATDTNDYCIDYMKKEADRRRLGNLHPVLVRKEGMDPFYGGNRYDLITIFHVSMTYEDQVAYFRELRTFLTKGGRLVLILYKIPTPFSPAGFTGDFRELIRELSREPEDSPFYRIFKESTRKRIGDHREQDPAGELMHAIVEDFNDALADNFFAAHFSNGSVFREEVKFLPEERRYADWFLPSYPDLRVRKPAESVRNKDARAEKVPGGKVFETINKLLIVQRYRKYLKKDGLFVSGFTPSVQAVFEKAGYRVEREHPDLIPFEDMIVLSAR